MLRLERVEISGFKSFYEKVDLAFPGRVTAVVGPNGCGKSNICDAVAWALGAALREACDAVPERIAIVATGGISHWPATPDSGKINEAWDREFLELIARDPERLANMSVEDFMRRGGNEGAEVIMWLIMRGALDERVKTLHQNYYLPMTTAMAVALFE